ncbi:MAG: hypothetical protein A2167_01805 [Planctomycetes bacterium RBG_13_46_10]|nr:MAG: hypothetical protein A2167_01805 [Planctomycetes bacterium RBG_13_46_10]QBM02883.1 hypothetical protein [uncultured archaeon]
MNIESNILLSIISYDSEINVLNVILQPLGRAIREISQRIENIKIKLPEEVLDSIIDNEYDFIESLLGAAFVVCQTYINSMASRAEHANKCLKEGITLKRPSF